MKTLTLRQARKAMLGIPDGASLRDLAKAAGGGITISAYRAALAVRIFGKDAKR